MSAIEQIKTIAAQADVTDEFDAYLSRFPVEFSSTEIEMITSNVIVFIKPDWFGLDLVVKSFLCSGPSPAERQAFESHVACQKLNAFIAGCVRLYPNNCRLSD